MSKEAETIELYSHFGYRVMDARTIGTYVTINFDRAYAGEDAEFLAYMEKDYRTINNKVPVAAIVWYAIGLGLAIVYAMFQALTIWLIFALITSIICFGIGTFFMVSFITISINRRKLINEIFKRCDRFQGLLIDYPLTKNIEAPSELTGQIKRLIPEILNNNAK